MSTKSFTLDKETGKVRLHRPISGVVLKNLCNVVSHTISVDEKNSRRHTLKFADGGSVEFAYRETGELIHLNCQRANVILSEKEGGRVEICLDQRAKAPGSGAGTASSSSNLQALSHMH